MGGGASGSNSCRPAAQPLPVTDMHLRKLQPIQKVCSGPVAKTCSTRMRCTRISTAGPLRWNTSSRPSDRKDRPRKACKGVGWDGRRGGGAGCWLVRSAQQQLLHTDWSPAATTHPSNSTAPLPIQGWPEIGPTPHSHQLCALRRAQPMCRQVNKAGQHEGRVPFWAAVGFWQSHLSPFGCIRADPSRSRNRAWGPGWLGHCNRPTPQPPDMSTHMVLCCQSFRLSTKNLPSSA